MPAAEEYPSNSFSPKIVKDEEPEKKAEPPREAPIFTGKVTRRNKSMGERLRHMFMEGGRQKFEGVVKDMLIPAAKDLAYDAVMDFIGRAAYGDNAPNRRGRRGGFRPGTSMPTNYGSFSGNSRPGQRRDEPRTMSNRARSQFEFQDIILPNRAAAQEILSHLYGRMEKYESARVSDLYDLLNITSRHTDTKYGWEGDMLQDSGIEPIRGGRDGYRLILPPPEPLD